MTNVYLKNCINPPINKIDPAAMTYMIFFSRFQWINKEKITQDYDKREVFSSVSH